MRLKNIIILAAQAIALVSCTMDIEYKGVDGKRMLIMNSVIKAGEQPTVTVSRSSFFLDVSRSGQTLSDTDGVTVSININGVEHDAHYVDSTKSFHDNRITTEGDIISITASHPEYGRATATDTIPHSHGIRLSSYTKSFVMGKTISELFSDDDEESRFSYDNVDSVLVAEIEIPGRTDTADFYVLEIYPTLVYYRWNGTQWDTCSRDLNWLLPASSKVLIGQSSANNSTGSEFDVEYDSGRTRYTFDDTYIKTGEKLSVEILMQQPDTLEYPYYDYPLTGGFDPSQLPGPQSIAHLIKDELDYHLQVKLYTLSSAYYYYHKSCLDFADADITFMSEPVTILHNVKGGAGILGTATCKEYELVYTDKFK